jgi:hypothetical protein
MTASNAQTGNETCPPPNGGEGDQVDVGQGEEIVDGGGNDLPPGSTGPDGPTDGGDGGGGGDWIWRHNLERMRNLCSLGLSPRMLSGVIMRLLKNHFSDPSLILTPNLEQYVWSEKPLESKIRIVKSVFFDPATAGQYPALVVKRMPLQSQRHSMADKVGTSRGMSSTDAMRGISHHSRFINGAHRIFCIAEADGESEDLAQEVFDVLSFLSPAIVERLPFHNFEVTGMGEQGALTETATQIGVPVDVTYTYEYAWTLQALAPRLKTFSLGPPQ